MALDGKALTGVTGHLLAARRAEAGRLTTIAAYLANQVIDIYVPKSATVEYRQLVDQSRFNVLPLLVNSLANSLFIDGYRPRREAENAPIWDAVWQPNRLDARQAGLWRSALTYGVSYARVLPGDPAPVVTPFSPRRLTALYADPINDEWPEYALTVGTPRPDYTAGAVSRVVDVAVYDDMAEYRFDVPAGAAAIAPYGQPVAPLLENFTIDPAKVETRNHDLGVCPVVRFLDSHGDLDCTPTGVVEPMLPAQRQLNQTTFGLAMAQQYAAFKQRWVTGMAIAEDEDGNPIEPWNAAVTRVWQAEEPDTKFGEFGQTDLGGYLDSRDKTLLYVASARQIPPHTLVVGNAVSNVSAEALAALEAGHQQDIAEHRTSLGEAAEQMLRLAGLAMGDQAAWEDTTAQVRWRDTTPRSLAQVADALGKLATLLGVPAQALWERIPDVTDQDLERWKELAQESDTFGRLEEMLRAEPGRQPADASAPV